jgi:tRNA threonylcarbamoyladenosine biosynthesis protein TsaB
MDARWIVLSTNAGSLILAIDTSTDFAAIGLDSETVKAEFRWFAGRTQTTSLLPAIDFFLHMNGVTIQDVTVVAVATGPGTFTGLRVGLSVAKGFVLAGDVQLIGIPTLEIAAFPYASMGTSVLAVLPAGRGRVVWQVFALGGGDSQPINSTVPELIEVLAARPELLVVGELLPDHRDLIVQTHSLIEPAVVSGRRPLILAELARQRLLRGEFDDPDTLEPRYVHGHVVAAGDIVDRLIKP